MRLHLLVTLVLSLAVQSAFSQFNCASDLIHDRKLKEDSTYRKNVEQTLVALQKNIQTQRVNRSVNAWFGLASATYTIPVAVHIIHTGQAIGTAGNPHDTTIQNTIAYLNSIYGGTMPGVEGAGNIGIQFVLANRDPNNNPTTGITRMDGSGIPNYTAYGVNAQTTNGVDHVDLKLIAAWDPTLYYNIYVVTKIDGNSGSGTFVAGFASFPSNFPIVDGTVMLAGQMRPNTKTLPHEIGHALSLHHPFRNPADPTSTQCPTNTSCAVDGDGICDTQPITIPPGFVCRTGDPNTCAPGNAPYTINTENNFMNYTTCFTLFTNDQRDRMIASLSLPGRKSLVNSWAKLPVYAYSFAPARAAACTPITIGDGVNNDYAGLYSVAVEDRYFSSGTTTYDGGYIDLSASPLHLIPASQGASFTFQSVVYGYNYEQVSAWVDFDDNGIFDPGEKIVKVDTLPRNLSLTGVQSTRTFSVPYGAITNKVLRMRVINEVSTVYGSGFTINDACYTPEYGQAEDYPFYITSVLPIQWKYFRGNRKEADVILDWATATESQSKYFVIERSTDGTYFTPVGTVAATGKATGSAYTYTDVQATAPLYFYRLKQVSADGSSKLSNVVIIRSDDSKTTNMVVANPFNNVIDIRFDQPITSAAELVVTDISGKTILKKSLSAGAQRAMIDLSGKQIAKGIYVLQAKFENKVITKKIMKN